MKNFDQRIKNLSPEKREILEQKLQEKLSRTKKKQIIQEQNITVGSPLSFSQQRLWLIDQLEPGSPLYCRPTYFRLIGELKVDALTRSFNEIIRRHDVLRSQFLNVAGEPVLKIIPYLELSLPITDLTLELDLEKQDTQAQDIQKILSEEEKIPFNLAQGPLIRARLLKLSHVEHLLLIYVHHIIFDAWSAELLKKEISVLYQAFSTSKPSPLGELKLQYSEFAQWQRQQFKGNSLQHQLDYWCKQLSGELPILELPTDKFCSAQSSVQGGTHALLLSKTLTDDLKSFSQQSGVTLFMVLLATFNIILYRQSGQESIIIGAPIAGRSSIETENLIGLFLNSLALRTHVHEELTFKQLLENIRETVIQAYSCQDIPFEKLVDELNPARSLAQNSIFDVMLNFANFSETTLETAGLKINPVQNQASPSKFTMTLYVREKNEQLHLKLVYKAALFTERRMQDFLRQFQGLLEQILVRTDLPIYDYSLVTREFESLLPNPKELLQESHYELVPSLILKQAGKSPDEFAICQGDHCWSYGNLAEKAYKIAVYLLGSGIKPGDVIVISGIRSFGLIASIFGVLRAGGVILLVDAQLPDQRCRTMLQEAKASQLLWVGIDEPPVWSMTLTKDCVSPDTAEVSTAVATATSTQQDLPKLQSNAPAYIFFTSGTTGVPKGVLGCHKSLAHFLSWQQRAFGIGPADRVAQLTALSFDVVLRDILLPLTSGATLCLPLPEVDLSAHQVLPWLVQQKITVLHTVPTLVESWLMNCPKDIKLPKLRWVFFAGEPLLSQLVARWRQTFSKAGKLVNLYGPTETTLAKCYYQIPDEPVEGVQPIGKGLPETQALIFSKSHQLCGLGEIGEIVLRTPFRTLGYVNAPKKQQQDFCPNPYRDDAEDILYYTGDLGRYRLDGSIEILGRADYQVKIHGVRIELQEIEAKLIENWAIARAVVMAVEKDRVKRLVAYIIPHGDLSLDSKELHRTLRRQLPGAMLPSAFVFLKTLPLTPNGKVDRQALPSPDFSNPLSGNEHVPPSTILEKNLSKIWCKVLNLNQISIHEDFFELGGNSLLATQVISRIKTELSYEIGLKLLFNLPTVAELANQIDQQESDKLIEISNVRTLDSLKLRGESPQQPTPLLFAQQRLWFLQQLEPDSTAYHIFMALHIEGELKLDNLRKTFTTLIQRHESLRTIFVETNGAVLQHQRDTTDLNIPLVDLSLSWEADESISQSPKLQSLLQRNIQRPFDLSRDLMLRATVIRLVPQQHVLQIVIHHIASDAWSKSIFLRELGALYQAFAAGQPNPLPELPLQYRDFAHWQRQQLQGDFLEEQLKYWQRQLQDAPPLLELPTDYLRPPVQTFQGKTEHFELSLTLTKQLKQLAQRSGVTLFMLLLSAFATLLHRYSGEEDIVIGSPIANRRSQELESLIGLFLNTLALRVKVNAEQPFDEVLADVKQTALDAYAHQDVPFEQLIEILKPTRDPSYSPWFQVMFIVQNTPRQALEIPGLSITPLSIEKTVAKFDITLSMFEREKRLVGDWEYSTDLFEPTTAKRMIEQFHRLLEEIVTSSNATVASFLCSEASEVEQSLSILNDQALARDREMQDADSLIEELADLSEEEVQKLLDDSV